MPDGTLQTSVCGDPNLWFLRPAKLMGLRRLPDALSISYGYCPRRVYVPYGPDWYRYWLRRVGESRGP